MYVIEHKIATLWSAEFKKYIFNGPPNVFFDYLWSASLKRLGNTVLEVDFWGARPFTFFQ
jgi:hypothetical protein